MNQFIRFPIQVITSGIIEFMQKSHFRVYASIDSHKDRKTWQSFPSLAKIREETFLDRGIIQNAIKDLIEWGLMKKARIRKKKGRGYKIVYTLIKEPQIKKPLKKIRDKISKKEKQKRDPKGRFTGLEQPSQRTVLNAYKQPSHTAIIREQNDKQPSHTASATKPSHTANPKSANSASNQSSISSSYPVKKNHVQNNSLKEKKPKPKPLTEEINLKPKKPKIDTSERAWTKGIDNFIGEKKKPKWPDDKHGKDDEKSVQKAR